jgi:hypothetical protein
LGGLRSQNEKDGSEVDLSWYEGSNGDNTKSCEVEALPPELLADIVDEHILANTDAKVRAHVLELEVEERERLQGQIAKLRLGRHGRESSVTPELARRALNYRAGGWSIRQIATKLGLKKSAIARELAKQ